MLAKLKRLPVWAWGVVGAVVIGGAFLLLKKKASAPAAAPPSTVDYTIGTTDGTGAFSGAQQQSQLSQLGTLLQNQMTQQQLQQQQLDTTLQTQIGSQTSALQKAISAIKLSPVINVNPVAPPPAPHVPPPPMPPVKSGPATKARYFTVTKWPAPGSSLSSIAAINGVSLSALEAANPQLAAQPYIYPGQVARIP